MNKKNYKLQIRISPDDKDILKTIREKDVDFNVSDFFRTCLSKKHAEIKEVDLEHKNIPS